MKGWIIKAVYIILLFLMIFTVKQMNDNTPLSIIKKNRLAEKMSAAGDKLTLRVSYFGLMPVGDASMENKGEESYRGSRVYHLSATASPLNLYSGFINAHAKVDSYVDTKKLHALRFTQSLILPNKPKDEKEVIYNQEQNFMELRGVKRKILPDTQDPLSAIFYIRGQEFGIGKIFDININTNQKNYQFYAEVIGREEYALKSGKIGVWILKGSVHRRDKNLYHRTTLKFWLLDNPSKIPVLVKAMTSAGQITARLTGVK